MNHIDHKNYRATPSNFGSIVDFNMNHIEYENYRAALLVSIFVWLFYIVDFSMNHIDQRTTRRHCWFQFLFNCFTRTTGPYLQILIQLLTLL